MSVNRVNITFCPFQPQLCCVYQSGAYFLVSVTGLGPRLRLFFVEINLKNFQGAQTPHQCKASFNSTHMQSVRPPQRTMMKKENSKWK